MDNIQHIQTLHLEYVEDRALEKTYCPSEVARKFDPNDWRDKMDIVRKVADELVMDGKLIVMQKGKKINKMPAKAKGPIRLRKP